MYIESGQLLDGELVRVVEQSDALRQLAVALGSHCPTLRAIRFSNVFYAYRAPREWVSFLDAVEMFDQYRNTAMDMLTGKTIPDAGDISRITHSSPRDAPQASPLISTVLEEINGRRNMIRVGGNGGVATSDFDMISPEQDTNLTSLINLLYESVDLMNSVVIANLGILKFAHQPPSAESP